MTRNALFALLPFVTACGGTPFVEEPRWSGEAVETALIWNGFHQEWGYNHRLNRLGNWVGPLACDGAECTAEVAHAAASGVGSDAAAWRADATAVRAPGVGFLAGSTAFEFDVPEAEGKALVATRTVTVPLEGLLADRSQYLVVLGGYDVFALEDADMLQSLRIAVGDVTVDAEAGTASFPVTFGLRVDCDTFECDGTWDVGGKLDQSVHYGAIVMWQVVAADDEVTARTIAVEDGYAWDGEDGDEVEMDDLATVGSVPGDRGAAYPTALVAVQSVSVDLDHASHFVEFATGATTVDYHPATGRLDYRADLFFKQWNAQTVEKAVAFGTPGEAHTEATLVALRFADATVAPKQASGAVLWSADGSPATGETAMDRATISLE